MRAPRRLWLLALLAITGLITSVIQAQHFFMVRSGMAGFKSFCTVGQAFNCDVIDASSYAEFIPGLPLSSFAAGWYIALLLVAMIARSPYWRREALRAALVLTSVATVFSIVYLVIMVTKIQTYCLLCLGIDAINLLALAIVLSLKPEGLSKHPLDRSKWKTFVGLTVGSLAIALIVLKSMDASNMSRTDKNEMVQSVLGSTPVSVNSGPEFLSVGPQDAPVTIVKFSDFQCPACRMGALTLHPVLQRYRDKVRFVFRNYPLDPACNSKMRHSGHPQACQAARIAWCANEQGKFKDAYEGLFEHQADIGSRLMEVAEEAGLNRTQLEACLAKSDSAAAVARDLQEGDRVGVGSTPTFFINGYRVNGALPTSVWMEIVEKLLDKN